LTVSSNEEKPPKRTPLAAQNKTYTISNAPAASDIDSLTAGVSEEPFMSSVAEEPADSKSFIALTSADDDGVTAPDLKSNDDAT
jgi:hypothetical protein